VLGTSHVVSIAVSDNSAGIAANLNTLQSFGSKLTSITQTTLTPLSLTIAQLNGDAGALGKISNAYTVTISDHSANIAANLDSLENLGSTLVSINQSGRLAALDITIFQMIRDATVLAKIAGSYSLSVFDTSTNIAAYLDSLQALGANIASITQTGSESSFSLSALQVKNDAATLAKISGNYSVVVSDTSANIAASLDALQGLGNKLVSINQTGVMAPLSITFAQLNNDSAALGKINGSYSLEVSGVTAVGAATIQANSHVTSIFVSDASANIAANLNTLQILVNDNKLAGITQTDVAAPLTLTVAQVTADAGVLALLGQSGSYSVAISDTSANIAAGLDELQSLGSSLTSIVQSGTIAPMTLTVTQLNNDLQALQKISGSYSITVSDTSTNILSNLSSLESNSSQINNIILTDSSSGNIPTLTLTATQYANYSDVLAEISSPYILSITGSGLDGVINGTGSVIAASELAPITIRAPLTATGQVTLSVYASVNGATPIFMGSETTNGATSVQFLPTGLTPQPSESISYSVTASDASGSLGAGQIEMTPGVFSGATISQSYATSLEFKFLSVSATGIVTGLPGSYSSSASIDYVLVGAETGDVSQTVFNTALGNYPVLQQYFNAGKVEVYGVDGQTQPDGINVTSPVATTSSGMTIPNFGNSLNATQNAILLNIPNLTSDTAIEMWSNNSSNIQTLLGTLTLTPTAPYAGFSGNNLVNLLYFDFGATLTPANIVAGAYQIFFTDTSGDNTGSPGQAIPGLQVGIPSPLGGAVTMSAAPSSSGARAITLEVGTVAQIANYAANTSSGATWCLIEDSTSNIRNAETDLTGGSLTAWNQLVSGNAIIGAFTTDGIAPPGVGSFNAQPYTAIQVGSSQNFIQNLGSVNTLQVHSVFAVQTTDAGVSHSIQLFDNGQALSGVLNLASDGSGALAVSLPSGVQLNNGDVITAKMDGNSVGLGIVPPGGGAPTNFVSNGINIWAGTVSELPTSLSKIESNTLYILEDSAGNLAELGASSIQTEVALALAASGNLTFQVTGGQLSAQQQYLIEQNNLDILNVSPVTIVDTLTGLAYVPILNAGDKMEINDDMAHLSYSGSALSSYFESLQLASPPIENTVILTDNLANLMNTVNQTIVQASLSANLYSLAGIVVSDTLADFTSAKSQLSSDFSILQQLDNNSTSYEVTDNLANLQQSNGGLTAAVTTFLSADPNSSVQLADNVANLESAYNMGAANNDLAKLASEISNGIAITVEDSIANISSLMGSINERGLYAQIKDIIVNDSAQNILSALQNGAANNPVYLASNLEITDSYANIQAAVNSDSNLLAEVSTVNITSGPKNGSQALTIDVTNKGSGNFLAIPELLLPFMNGNLNATEAKDSSGSGILVTINDTSGHSISIDLVGVTDATMNNGTGQYTNGGWYHV
jgi:hypothetical protein